MSKYTKRLISLLLILGILLTGIPSSTYAETADVLLTDEPVEIKIDENDLEDSDSLSEEVYEELEEELDSEIEQYLESLDELSEDEIEKKEELSEDLSVVAEETAGEDYIEDEVILMCETIEEAERIAEDYAAVTGATVVVDSFEYGVAVLKIYNYDGKKARNSGIMLNSVTDSVEAFVEIASDTDINLPAVYPNYIRYLDSVNTDNESFEDPFTKSEDSNYQWYHELIGSKYIWHELEAMDTEGDQYDGWLSREFKDNLENTIVAVVDSGVNVAHEDIDESIIVGQRNVIDNNSDVSDAQGHGTNIAGIIGSTANNLGGRGVAAGVKIMPVKVTNGKTLKDSSVVTAINYIVERKNSGDNVKVINLSVGSPSFSSVYKTPIKNALDAGIVVCASAGNDDSEELHYPSSLEGVISVASVNSNYSKSKFSNFGETVDISAPGGDNGADSTLDSSDFWRYERLVTSSYSGNSTYAGQKGTSQATAVASAVIAMVSAAYPDMSPKQIEDRIKSASTTTEQTYDIGTGCVNVAKALGYSGADDEVEADIASGSQVAKGTVINLTTENSDAAIYYTLDGTKPNVDDAIGENSRTKIYYSNEGIILDGDTDKAVTISACSLLYGNLGDIKTFKYTYAKGSVQSMTVKSETGTNKLSVDSTMKLIAEVAPYEAANKKVTWSSSNTAVATVNSSGIVTARSDSAETVTITATATDGSDVFGTFDISIIPQVSNLTIDPLDKKLVNVYQDDTLLLYVGAAGKNTYDLSDKWTIWPSNASKDVVYSSSNSAVAAVDEDGLVTAVKSGTATITVMAADGSKIKDTLKVRCETGLFQIDISSKPGIDYVVAGKTLTPVVTFNDGKSVPDDKTLTWSVVSGDKVITINKDTGVVNAKDSETVASTGILARKAKIRAYSEKYGVSGEYSFDVFPLITDFTVKESKLNVDGKLNIMYGSANLYSFSSYINTIKPTGYLDEFEYKTSNSNVVAINKTTGEFRAIKPGNAKITMMALDGSKKSCSINVTVLDESYKEIGLVNKTGTFAIYPGKEIQLEAVCNSGARISNNSVTWKIRKASDSQYISGDDLIHVNNGTILLNPEEATKLGKMVTYYVKASMTVDNEEKKATTCIYVYPEGASSVTTESEITIDEIGGTYKLNPSVEPATGYSEFKYSTSNSKVAKVYTDGTVEAVANGTAVITTKVNDGSGKYCKCKVTVSHKVTSISLTTKNDQTTLGDGKSLQVTANVNKNPGEIAAGNSKVTWKIEECDADGNVIDGGNASTFATISSKGVVKAKTGISEVKYALVTATSVYKNQNGEAVTGTLKLSFYPSMKKIVLSDTAVNLTYPETTTVLVSEIVPNTAGKDLIVTSSNIKVATVEKVEDAEGTYKINAVGTGKATVRFMAADGSGKYATTSVKVTVPVTELTIFSKKGFTVKAGGSLSLGVTANNGATNANATYRITEIDGEPIEDITDSSRLKYATINAKTGAIKAGSASVVGYDEHEITVVATAKDGIGVESAPVTVKVLPTKFLVKSLNIKSSTNKYELAGGSSLQMQAVTNSDATNKKVKWSIASIKNKEGVEVAKKSEVATISSSGLLKAVKDINACYTVKVKCEALDGSSVVSDRDIALYPRAISHVIESTPEKGIKTIIKGGQVVLKIRAIGLDDHWVDADRPDQKYAVTYTTGSAKVYLNNDDGNEVTVKGYKVGSCTVTFKALDGSNKKTSYTINIVEGAGWKSANGHKYYVDADTEELVTGFNVIDDKLYYFSESSADYGAMKTGLFTVTDLGADNRQDYYDTDTHASNRYYADKNGVVFQGEGWYTIAKEPGNSSSQKWSYYLSKNTRNVVIDGCSEPLTGEIVLGDVYIDDGVVTYLDGAAVDEARIDNYYMLDENTGARKKKVLYFYGNYHGDVIADSQINSLKSIAKYINSDEKFQTASEDVIYANSDDENERNRLNNLGLTSYNVIFPRAASSYVPDENKKYENERYELIDEPRHNRYIAESDIAKWDEESGTIVAGSDGNVDVYDTQMYSIDLYEKAIAKYGPNNLVLAGASSGGGTVVALCQFAADNGIKQPKQVILLSPWVDVSMTNPDCKKISSSDAGAVDKGSLEYWGARYTRDANFTRHETKEKTYSVNGCAGPGVMYPFASPIYGSFEGLTSDYYIYTGGFDYCEPDTVKMAGKLRGKGLYVDMHDYSKTVHGYMFEATKYQTKTLIDVAENIMTERSALELD